MDSSKSRMLVADESLRGNVIRTRRRLGAEALPKPASGVYIDWWGVKSWTMSEREPRGPILRRTWSVSSSRVRVLSAAEERRLARPRFRSRLAVAFDLDRRLAALGYTVR